MTTLSEVVETILGEYRHMVMESTLLKRFPAHDLAYLVNLGVLGVDRINYEQPVYWLRPLKIEIERKAKAERERPAPHAKVTAEERTEWAARMRINLRSGCTRERFTDELVVQLMRCKTEECRRLIVGRSERM